MPAQTHLFRCLQDNFGVLVHDPASGATAAIDAPEAAPVEAALKATGWKLTDILVTHHHGDHTGGIAELKERHNCRVIGAAQRGRAHSRRSTRPCGEGDTVKVGELAARVIETPGHTAGHITYCVRRRQARFRRRHAVLDRLRPRDRGHAGDDVGVAAQAARAARRHAGLSAATNTPPANIRFAKTIEPTTRRCARARAGGRRACSPPASRRPVADRRRRRRRILFLRADVPAVAAAVGPCRQIRRGGVRRSPRAEEQVLMPTAFGSPARRRPLTAADIIRLLDLKPHPEGGHFRETFRDSRTVDGSARGLDRDLFPARARRALALASRRRGRGLALVRRRAARARRSPKTNARTETRHARTRSRRRRAAAGDRAGGCVAGGRKSRRLDAGRLHGRAGIRVRRLRTGAEGLGARVQSRSSTHMYCPPFTDSVEPVMKSGVVGGEEHHAARDLLRLAEPADRDLRQDDLLQHVLRHRLHHLGVDIARADRVDGDAERARSPAPAPW